MLDYKEVFKQQLKDNAKITQKDFDSMVLNGSMTTRLGNFELGDTRLYALIEKFDGNHEITTILGSEADDFINNGTYEYIGLAQHSDSLPSFKYNRDYKERYDMFEWQITAGRKNRITEDELTRLLRISTEKDFIAEHYHVGEFTLSYYIEGEKGIKTVSSKILKDNNFANTHEYIPPKENDFTQFPLFKRIAND